MEMTRLEMRMYTINIPKKYMFWFAQENTAFLTDFIAFIYEID